jgi:hypothetical protein
MNQFETLILIIISLQFFGGKGMGVQLGVWAIQLPWVKVDIGPHGKMM